jgi:anhydro-N-acetylmuramic acid kinase
VTDATSEAPLRAKDAERSLTIIGLMSGTSADGISAAAAAFVGTPDTRVRVDLLAHLTRPYGSARRERLLAAIDGTSPAAICLLHAELGGWFAEAALEVMRERGLTHHEVAAIASHGHTLWHEPGVATWQIGSAAAIAERVGVPVISDFRARDVAAGGQGAPLVPMADALLFSSPTQWRALQNLGGIANVTVVPPGGDLSRVRAFDTGPGCAVIDGVTRALVPSLPYDVDGALAASGAPSGELVEACMAEPYFRAPPPKSTGRELFSRDWIARFIHMARSDHGLTRTEDIIASAVALTARSIADALHRFVDEPVAELVISGGGARNPTLVRAIAAHVAPVRVLAFDALFFDGEAKEAVAFALLGYLHLLHAPGNVPSATGARGPRILGAWSPA